MDIFGVYHAHKFWGFVYEVFIITFQDHSWFEIFSFLILSVSLHNTLHSQVTAEPGVWFQPINLQFSHTDTVLYGIQLFTIRKTILVLEFRANNANKITKPLYYSQDNLLWWSPPAFWCALQWSARRSRTCVLQADNLNAKKRGYEARDSCCCLTIHL